MRFVRLTLALAGICIALTARPAFAAPPSASITAVRAVPRCSTSPCASSDPKLASNAIIAGAIEVAWRATSDLGLEFVRLEARIDAAGPWYCVQRWEPTGARSASDAYRWDTSRWPAVNLAWRCTDSGDPDHRHGEPTTNGSYELRMFARDLTGDSHASKAFVVRVNNAPVRPAWAEDPKASKPPVTLRWFGNLEPDLIRYDLARTGPDGRVDITSIDPARPADANCHFEDGPFLVCSDERFGGRRSGRYTYRLTAVRRGVAGGAACSAGAHCLSSQASVAKSVRLTISGATEGSTPGATAVATPSAGVTLPASESASPSPTVSSPAVHRTLAAGEVGSASESGAGSRALPVALAVVLLGGVIVAQAADLIRWSRAHPEP